MTWESTEQLHHWCVAALVVYAIGELLWLRRARPPLREVRTMVLGALSQGALMGVLAFAWRPVSVGAAASLGASLSPWSSGLSVGAWVLGFVVYEFFYWLQHILAHKVRLLWCMHSPHHTPSGMYMYVGLNHSALETTFHFSFFNGLLPGLLGFDPLIVMAINVADLVWGSFLHVSDRVWPVGRLGMLGQVLQTPSHHRAHHAQNLRYMDTNYCSMTLLWDRLLGTFEPLRDGEPVTFGITRPVDTGSFVDSHLGELALLWRDVRNARSLRDVLGYMFCAPGWKPDDPSGTVTAQKALHARS